jgi:hypothetical protein
MSLHSNALQGRMQDFKLGGGALKKIGPREGRRENIWGISCEKSRFYAKKIIFFPILGGGAPDAPPLDPPLNYSDYEPTNIFFNGVCLAEK